MSRLLDWAQALETSGLGPSIAESVYAFPLLDAAHLLGLAFSIGLLAIADLRLLGLVLKKTPAVDVLNQLRPWVLAGFAVTFASGVLLFWAEAAKMIFNPAFVAKLVFLVLACANALVFETRLAPLAAQWGENVRLPAAARFAGLASLTLWGLVLLTGRLIPYLS